MPTYLCHGFRWDRAQIRIFVIIHDLEDAAPDWIIGYDSAALILDQLYESFPFLPQLQPAPSDSGAGDGDEKVRQERRHPDEEDAVLVHQWSAVKLLEEYDMAETTIATRPYAYMADHVVRVDLSTDVVAEMAKYEARSNSQSKDGDRQEAKGEEEPWFVQLRDKVQPGEEIRWYIVVCDDEERDPYPHAEDEDDDQVMNDVDEVVSAPPVENTLSLPHRPAPPSDTIPDASSPNAAATGDKPQQSIGRSGPEHERPGRENGRVPRKSSSYGKQSISGGLRRLLGKKDRA